jgi:hypothetical protein
MAGLFDPSMFPNVDAPGAMGLFARLAGMGASQPMGLGGLPPAFPPIPPQQQPGADAMASGIIPPQGQPAPQSAPPMRPPMQAPQGGGGFMDALQGFLGNHSNALMGLGAGIASGGLMRGVPGMAAGGQMDYQRNMQQSSLAATYQSLIQSGVPPAQAQAMTLNPELLKTLAPQHFAKPTFGDVGMSPTGIPIKGWIDSNTRKVTDAAGNPIGGTGTSASQGPADDTSLTGPAYIDAIRSDPRFGPQKADLVQGIVAGKLPYPSGMLLKTPYGQWLQGAISQADPNLNAQTYQQRQKAFNDFYGGGKDQSGVQQIRQAADHGVALIGSLDRLGNYSGGSLVNKPLNEIGNAIGTNVEYGPAQLNVHALADELSKIWKGGGNSDAEVRAWENGFPVNGTIAQQRAAVGKAAELYEGGIKAMERKHSDSFGSIAPTLPPIIDPQAEQSIAAMKAWSNGGKAAGAAKGTASQLPPQAESQLKEGIHTKFRNGQVWTLQNGQPVQVQ